ncbi:DUF2807 domain-containing protein [Rhodothermaceae bacterium RA]|nr:DUF2807 domain-containing protein [Rhodothermaceae bacterium RA]
MHKLLLSLILALGLTACEIHINVGQNEIEGSGDLIEEQRDVGGFDEVVFSLPGHLVIEQTGTEGLRVEAEANLMEHILTEVDGRTLKIRTRHNTRLTPHEGLRFHLTVDDLRAVTIAGTGDVEAAGLQTEAFTLSVAGAGDARLTDLSARELAVEIAGAGDVELTGKASRQSFSLAGVGDVDARALLGETAEVNIAGSGSATVHVRDRLEVNILGSGSVYYLGAPTIDRKVLGAGTIEPLE